MNSVTVAAERLAPGEDPVFHHEERVTCEIDGVTISDARIYSYDPTDGYVCQNIKCGACNHSGNKHGYKYSWWINNNKLANLRHGDEPGVKLTNLPLTEIVSSRVIFNGKATIVFWEDGTKTVTKCSADDTFDPKMGFLMAYFRHHSGMTKTQTAKYLKRTCVLEER